MAQQWRILVVEGDEYLNQGIVNSLLKDGYSVQGVLTGAEAIRILWADEQNLVIGDMQLPDADGFDLLQWIRTYCPQTRMIMLALANVPGARTRALENGAVGYLEKPVDLRLLKVEARRLLQQTGFTASLASFDLLDVIQIVNMSRKSISLVVHTGLEEQGMLGFQEGELTWAEYGTLRGEEAFFALAAHKNGMVTQQAWDERVVPNVRQPLSRLIMQALQYRAKYAAAQQLSGELEAVNRGPNALFENNASPLDTLLTEEVDDRPFTYVAEPAVASSLELASSSPVSAQPISAEPKEWWQDSARSRAVGKAGNVQAVTGNGSSTHKAVPHDNKPAAPVNGSSITPSTVRKTNTGQRPDLPSWLMDQPTQFELQALRPSSLNGTGQMAATPVSKPSPAEWQPAEPAQPIRPAKPAIQTNSVPAANRSNGKTPYLGTDPPVRVPSRPLAEWQAPPQTGSEDAGSALHTPSGMLQSLAMRRQTDELSGREAHEPGIRGAAIADPAPVFVPDKLIAPLIEEERPVATPQPNLIRRNYPALVSALQTLGYTLPGFIASAVVGMDGQPIAQVAIEDSDIASICPDLGAILKGIVRVLQQGNWGQHDDTIVTSKTHHIMLRVLDREREIFQVLITTRESDPIESLEVMATVESTIVAAL